MPAVVLVIATQAHASTPTTDDDTASTDRVFGGVETEGCQYSTVVAVKGGGLCTGVLAHPQLVIYAAHCGAGEKIIHFGNTNTTGGKQVATANCQVNPAYVDNIDGDWAFCKLSRELDIPFSPPAMGCELESIAGGGNVVQVGYGANGGSHTQPLGTGKKRWGVSSIHDISNGTITLGGDGISGCPGDSGGPALVQLDDGTWRTVGITSVMLGTECGARNIYAYLPDAISWIESESGIDITPCHDDDGNWAPTEQCGGFSVGGSWETPPGTGDWGDWCADLETSGFSETCGLPFVLEEDEPTATGDTATGSTSSAANTGGGVDHDSNTGMAAEDDGDDDPAGCDCATSTGDGSPRGALAGIVLVAALRRRNSRARSRRSPT